ncbi:MAG: hypothetical protein K9I71_13160 [Ignavibacteriales bacterium]|nr:hypothetical protein [Ignavibacteriales bacterium]MCF8317073.1 hypothetical protein [Ignavibacteriales bacterium]MCF8438658.1 hypothetical protein [Ignavibacteriales bacterium]
MKRNLILISALLLAVFLSCKEEPTDPVTPKPVGWQDDVPWPSLAASPWPMYRHDPQNTGRSKFPGPGSISNIVALEGFYSDTPPVIGIDSSVYLQSAGNMKKGLYSYYMDGSLKWNNPGLDGFDNIVSPVLLSSGDILFLDACTGLLSKIDHRTGLLLVQKNLSAYMTSCVFQKSIQVDKNGNIFLLSNTGKLVILNSSMEIIHTDNNPDFQAYDYNIVFTADGRGALIAGKSNPLYYLNTETYELKPLITVGIIKTLPVVDAANRVYFVISSEENVNLVCMQLNGNVIWQHKLNRQHYNNDQGYFLYPEPAISREGKIILPADSLYSFNYYGKVDWKVYMQLQAGEYSSGNAAIDSEGRIYLMTGNFSVLRCYDKYGQLIVAHDFTNEVLLDHNPVIGYCGSLVLGGVRENKVFLIK